MASNDVYLRGSWGRVIPSDDFFIRRLMGERGGGKFLTASRLDVGQWNGYRNCDITVFGTGAVRV